MRFDKDANPQMLSFDSETTGLYPNSGATILTFAAAHESGKNFTVTIQPTTEEWENAHPKALQVNGLTWADVANGVPILEAGDMFGAWLTKHELIGKHTMFVGQNPGFDMRFMWHFWRDVLENIGFPTKASQVLDAQTVYIIWQNQKNNKVLPASAHTSLKNICLAVGIPPEPEPHDALQGAMTTLKVIQKMTNELEELRSLSLM